MPVMKKWKDTSHKLNIVGEIQHLTKNYFMLVDSLGNMFLSLEEKEKLKAEIIEIEKSLSSKLKISSMMRGF